MGIIDRWLRSRGVMPNIEVDSPRRGERVGGSAATFDDKGNVVNKIRLTTKEPGVAFHEGGHLDNGGVLRRLLGDRLAHRADQLNRYGLKLSYPLSIFAKKLPDNSGRIDLSRLPAYLRNSLMRRSGLSSVLLHFGASPALSLGLAATAPQDSAAGQNAYLLPLGTALPTLVGEASASLKGLTALGRARGLGTALRSAPSLLGRFGTYAVAPIAASAAAFLMNRGSLGRAKSLKEAGIHLAKK